MGSSIKREKERVNRKKEEEEEMDGREVMEGGINSGKRERESALSLPHEGSYKMRGSPRSRLCQIAF